MNIKIEPIVKVIPPATAISPQALPEHGKCIAIKPETTAEEPKLMSVATIKNSIKTLSIFLLAFFSYCFPPHDGDHLLNFQT